MNILVTGGAGYVGTVLLPLLLEAGHRVTVLDSLRHGQDPAAVLPDHRALSFVKKDLLQSDEWQALLVRGHFNAVVHLAAIAHAADCEREPEVAETLHVGVTEELARVAAESGVKRFVLASTCSVYGEGRNAEEGRPQGAAPTKSKSSPVGAGLCACPVPETPLLTEFDPPRPISVYGRTKLAGEKAILAHAGSMEAVVLRFATACGLSPRMRWDLLVNEFARDGAAGKTLELYGADLARPYLHVQEMAKALLLSLETPSARIAGRVLLVARDEENYSKREIVEQIRGFLSTLRCLEVQSHTADTRNYRVSGRHFREATGFSPRLGVREAISEILAEIRRER